MRPARRSSTGASPGGLRLGGLRLGGLLLGGLWLVSLSGCDRARDGGAVLLPEVAVAGILLGDGAACFTDAQCGPAGARGACVLATCFGLLTTDNHAARAALVERLAAAAPAVREVARPLLRRAAVDKGRTRSGRLGAVAGLGAMLRPGGGCQEDCEVLRSVAQDPDEPVAVAARLALAARADPTVRAQLIDDTRLGTEHLRAAAATSLAGYVGAPGDGEVLAALIALLRDRAPPVRDAALGSLGPVAGLPEVRRALRRAHDMVGGGMTYRVDRLLGAAASGRGG